MRRCERCVMPETVPGITFDEAGICSYCLDYQEEEYYGQEKLERIIASVKKRGNEYDCIVPLSGGRDSTYVLYLASVIHNLKVLAVNYDNEFRVDQALTNMRNACKRLGVDFVSVRSRWDIAHKFVRSAIRSPVPFGEFGLCRACAYGYRSVVYRAAEEHKVPLILWGESQAEATLDMERKAFKALGRKGSRLRKCLNIDYYRARYYLQLQRLEFHVPGNRILSRKPPILSDDGVRGIRVFDYIPWDRDTIKETITRELGWEKPDGHVSTWRTDCMLHALVNYCFFVLFGCSKDCFGYCNMINSGQMAREEALRQEEEMAANHAKNVRELLEDKIGLSEEEADRILSFRRNQEAQDISHTYLAAERAAGEDA